MGKLEDLKAELERNERRKIEHAGNPNKIQAIDAANEKILEEIAKLEAEQKEKQDKLDTEIQELVLGYNFNEIFGDPEANKLIHGILMTEAQKYQGKIDTLYAEIEQKDKENVDAREQISIKSDELDRLQADYESVKAKADELAGAEDRVNGLKRIIEEKDAEIEDLKSRIEDEMKESRYYRNECARYEMEARRLRSENEELQRNRQIDKDTNTSEVAQRIQQRTNEKRKLANVRTNPDGSITGTDAEGSEVTVPWFAKNSIEAVETFPNAPQASVENGSESNPPLVEEPTFQIPNDVEGVHGLQPEASGGDHGDQRADPEASGEAVTREEFEALKARVDGLYHHAGITDGAA